MTETEAQQLAALVSQQVTLITNRDSVYVGTLVCVPNHARLLLKDMAVYHKNGFFKASSGSSGQNSRLFKLASVKTVTKTEYVQDEALTRGILSIVKVPNMEIFEHKFPDKTGLSRIMLVTSNGRVHPKDHVAVWIKHPEKDHWLAGSFPIKDLPSELRQKL